MLEVAANRQEVKLHVAGREHMGCDDFAMTAALGFAPRLHLALGHDSALCLA